MARQATLTLQTPQLLLYAQAVCLNKEVIDDFFSKLGAIFGCTGDLIPGSAGHTLLSSLSNNLFDD